MSAHILLSQFAAELPQLFKARLLETRHAMSEALFDASNRQDEAADKKRVLDAREKIDQLADAWVDLAVEEYERIFEEKKDPRKRKTRTAKKFDAEAMALVEDEQVREGILFDAVCRRARDYANAEVLSLTKRLEGLLGEEHLPDRHNPIVPRMFFKALLHAWEAIELDTVARCDVLAACELSLRDAVETTIHDANEILVDQGFMVELPASYGKIVRSGRGGEDGLPDAAGLASMLAKLVAQQESTNNVVQSQAAILAKLFAPTMAAADAKGANKDVPQLPAITPEVLETLNRVTASLKPEPAEKAGESPSEAPLANLVREAQPKLSQSMQPVQAVITDVVAGFFDKIFADPSVPDPVKVLVGRLQIQMLKASIKEPQIFTDPAHPFRRFIDLLADTGTKRQDALVVGNPLYEQMVKIVERLNAEYDVDSAAVANATSALLAVLDSEENASQAALMDSMEEIQRQEKHALAQSMAKFVVDQRLQSASLPDLLVELARTHWQSILAVDHVVGGEGGDNWKADVQTLDDMIASVKPVTSQEARQKLATLIPALVPRLTQGLERVGLRAEEREPYFQELAQIHAAALRSKKVASVLQSEVAPAPAAAVLVTDPRLKRRATSRSQGIERGQWLELVDEDGHITRCKLSWVSPMQETFILKNFDTRQAITLQAEEWRELSRQGRLRVIADESLTEKGLEQAVKGLLDDQIAPADTRKAA